MSRFLTWLMLVTIYPSAWCLCASEVGESIAFPEGFSVMIPEGWSRFSGEEHKLLKADLRYDFPRAAKAEVVLDITENVSSAENTEAICIIVALVKCGRLNQNAIDLFCQKTSASPMKKFGSYGLSESACFYDPINHILWNQYQLTQNGELSVLHMQAHVLTSFGAVMVGCITPAAREEEAVGKLQFMVDHLVLESKALYTAEPKRPAFQEIAWRSILPKVFVCSLIAWGIAIRKRRKENSPPGLEDIAPE